MIVISEAYQSWLAKTSGEPTASAILTLAEVLESQKARPETCESKHGVDDMLSITDTAKWLGVCDWTVRSMVKSGRLPASRIGSGRGVLRISPADVRKYQRQSGSA